MSLRTMSLVLAVGCALATLSVTRESDAGPVDAPYASCVTFSDGSGSCSGTFLGFRNSPNYDWVSFGVVVDPNGSHPYFSANYDANGRYAGFYCAADPSMLGAWTVPIASRGHFSIDWDAHAKCTYAFFDNGSKVQTY
jgi:hypothetical protein